MVINCEIKFDQNPYGIYFAGQTLSGRAELRLDKPKKVKGVCLKIAGYAHCHWTERHSTGSGSRRQTRSVSYIGREDYVWTTTYFIGSEEGIRIFIDGQAKTSWCETESYFEDGKHKSRDIFYSADEVYLDAKAYLLGMGDNGNQLELSAGQHSYSFSCALPPMLPTSYEGTYGHIRYTVRLVLERPWKFDQSYKVAFTVLKPFDLNYDSPILRIPTQMELTKNFCCGPCRTGPFSIVASIPQSGFVSGQIIKVSAEVTNMSTIPVDEMKFLLRKIVAYHSQTPSSKTKEEIVDIQERRTGGVAKNDHGRFLVSLPVPPVPPTNTNLCKVIHITYEIKVEARLSGLHSNPYIRIPITIGTIPLNLNYPDPKNPVINTLGQQPPITVQPLLNTITQPQLEMPQPYDQLTTSVATISVNNAIEIPNSVGAGSSNNLDGTPIINPITNAGSVTYQEMRKTFFRLHYNFYILAPPSYEETMGGTRRIEDDDDQHTMGQQLYTPRYPVYHFNEMGRLQTIDENQITENANNQRCTAHPEKILEKMEMI